MDKDIIHIIFSNKENHDIVDLFHEAYVNRNFTGNVLKEFFIFDLTKEEIKELAKNLNAAAD
jgi:hypothetical protein